MGDDGRATVGQLVLTGAAVALVLAVAVLMGLRSAGDHRDCTLIGSGPSSVSVRLEGAGWALTELCVDDECEEAHRVEVSADPGVHPFRASLVDPGGRTVERAGEVTTVEVWPNGEGCGRRRAYATISIGADGTATTVDPWPARSGSGPQPD